MIQTEKMPTEKTINAVIVDDSFLMRNILKNIIKKDSRIHVIGEAANGEEAMILLEKGVDPDVILLDIEMPVMNGLQFLEVSQFSSRAKVIVISSVTKMESPESTKARELGVADIINKPSGVLSVDMEETRSREILDSIYRCCAAQ